MASRPRVFARIRPIQPHESNEPAFSAASSTTGLDTISFTDVTSGEPRLVRFDGVVPPEKDTRAVADLVGSEIVKTMAKGISSTILAYGQTGCGKTYTFEGPKGGKGLIHYLIEEAFKSFSGTAGSSFTAQLSVVQVFAKDVLDMLNDNARLTFQMHELKERKWETVTDIANVQQLFGKAMASRKISETKMNKSSSRSHVATTLRVAFTVGGVQRTVDLNMVDLAGSERVKDSGVTGTALEEARNINLSLSALSRLVNDMVIKKGKFKVGREYYTEGGTLLELLHRSLGGSNFLAIVLCLSPSAQFFQETQSTLRFGTTCLKLNIKPLASDLVVTDPQAIIEELRAQLANKDEQLKSLEGQLEQARTGPIAAIDQSSGEDERLKLMMKVDEYETAMQVAEATAQQALADQKQVSAESIKQLEELRKQLAAMAAEVAKEKAKSSLEEQVLEEATAIASSGTKSRRNSTFTNAISKLQNAVKESKLNPHSKDSALNVAIATAQAADIALKGEQQELKERMIVLEKESKTNAAAHIERDDIARRIEHIERLTEAASRKVFQAQASVLLKKAHVASSSAPAELEELDEEVPAAAPPSEDKKQQVADIIKLTKGEIKRLQDLNTNEIASLPPGSSLGAGDAMAKPLDALQNLLRVAEGFDPSKDNVQLLWDNLTEELSKVDEVMHGDPLQESMRRRRFGSVNPPSSVNLLEQTMGPSELSPLEDSFRRSPRRAGTPSGLTRKPTSTHPIVAYIEKLPATLDDIEQYCQLNPISMTEIRTRQLYDKFLRYCRSGDLRAAATRCLVLVLDGEGMKQVRDLGILQMVVDLVKINDTNLQLLLPAIEKLSKDADYCLDLVKGSVDEVLMKFMARVSFQNFQNAAIKSLTQLLVAMSFDKETESNRTVRRSVDKVLTDVMVILATSAKAEDLHFLVTTCLLFLGKLTLGSRQACISLVTLHNGKFLSFLAQLSTRGDQQHVQHAPTMAAFVIMQVMSVPDSAQAVTKLECYKELRTEMLRAIGFAMREASTRDLNSHRMDLRSAENAAFPHVGVSFLGEWTSLNSGGSDSCSVVDNPQYNLCMKDAGQVVITLSDVHYELRERSRLPAHKIPIYLQLRIQEIPREIYDAQTGILIVTAGDGSSSTKTMFNHSNSLVVDLQGGKCYNIIAAASGRNRTRFALSITSHADFEAIPVTYDSIVRKTFDLSIKPNPFMPLQHPCVIVTRPPGMGPETPVVASLTLQSAAVVDLYDSMQGKDVDTVKELQAKYVAQKEVPVPSILFCYGPLPHHIVREEGEEAPLWPVEFPVSHENTSYSARPNFQVTLKGQGPWMVYTRLVEDRKLSAAPIGSEYHARWTIRSTTDVSIEPWHLPFKQRKLFKINLPDEKKDAVCKVRAKGKLVIHVRPAGGQPIYHAWEVSSGFSHKKQRSLGVCLVESKTGNEIPLAIHKFDDKSAVFEVVLWSTESSVPSMLLGDDVSDEVVQAQVRGSVTVCPEVAEEGEDANALREGALFLAKQEEIRNEEYQRLEHENYQLRARVDQLIQLLVQNNMQVPPEPLSESFDQFQLRVSFKA